MKKLTENPYDLLPVTIAGDKLHTRPIEFEMDDTTAANATKYHSTCPKCSQLIEFTPNDVYQRGDEYFVSGCNECPIPAGCSKVCGTVLAVPAPATTTPSSATVDEQFIDPIAAGIMKLEGAVLINV